MTDQPSRYPPANLRSCGTFCGLVPRRRSQGSPRDSERRLVCHQATNPRTGSQTDQPPASRSVVSPVGRCGRRGRRDRLAEIVVGKHFLLRATLDHTDHTRFRCDINLPVTVDGSGQVRPIGTHSPTIPELLSVSIRNSRSHCFSPVAASKQKTTNLLPGFSPSMAVVNNRPATIVGEQIPSPTSADQRTFFVGENSTGSRFFEVVTPLHFRSIVECLCVSFHNILFSN